MRAPSPLAVLAGALALACGGEERAAPAAAAGDAGAADASTVEPFRLSVTIPGVAPGEEGTRCVKARLGNTEPVRVGRIHNLLSRASHHFVVSTVEKEGESEQELYECPPFRAPLTGSPLAISQRHDDDVALPPGTAYAIGAEQLLHLEVHYLNTGTETTDVVATTELYPVEPGATVEEASFLLVGDLAIRIPPGGEHAPEPVRVPLPAEYDGVRFFAMTGHTHQFGTGVRVGIAAQGAAPEVVYDPPDYDWAEPVTKNFDPYLEVPPGGEFSLSCRWNNTTDTELTFGESALQEMCFFWAYYFPRRAAQRVLLHGIDSAYRNDAGAVLPGPACAAPGAPGNDQGVGRQCVAGDGSCDTGTYCLSAFTRGEFGNFCTRTCTADTDCGAGAICRKAAATSQSAACIPSACVASLDADGG